MHWGSPRPSNVRAFERNAQALRADRAAVNIGDDVVTQRLPVLDDATDGAQRYTQRQCQPGGRSDPDMRRCCRHSVK